MQFRTLGRTGLEVSRVGLGTGGPSRIGQWTHGDETRMHELVHRALDLGINLIDTAADYSDSEEILGRALAGVSCDRYVLATKFNPDPSETDTIISPQQVIDSCERSLKRMQVDCIDVYQFHGLVPSNYRAAVDQLYPTVERLREQGKIRFIGVTEYFYRDPGHEMLVTALDEDIWDTIMVKYGILNMAAERDVLPRALAQNVGVMNMSAVRKRMTRPDDLKEIVGRWKREGLLAEDALPEDDPLGFLVHDRIESVVAAGYKFGAAPEAVSSVLVGTGNIAHLEANTETILGGPLPDDDVERLRSLFGGIAETERESA